MRALGIKEYVPGREEHDQENAFMHDLWEVFARYELIFIAQKLPIVLANLFPTMSDDAFDRVIREIGLIAKGYRLRLPKKSP